MFHLRNRCFHVFNRIDVALCELKSIIIAYIDQRDLQTKVKKPTSWYKPQCGSARLKPPARFYTVYSSTAG
ncbi:hypothetical protein Taro_031890 [Colocasia esculenta]|uniref:Uncharacterized protein n=1 Tax=Colocasia esculenta TaxID=4460 RepID=A0A843W088_COLES|nr:hypothetical protein [Colocasia esculenta]